MNYTWPLPTADMPMGRQPNPQRQTRKDSVSGRTTGLPENQRAVPRQGTAPPALAQITLLGAKATREMVQPPGGTYVLVRGAIWQLRQMGWEPINPIIRDHEAFPLRWLDLFELGGYVYILRLDKES